MWYTSITLTHNIRYGTLFFPYAKWKSRSTLDFSHIWVALNTTQGNAKSNDKNIKSRERSF